MSGNDTKSVTNGHGGAAGPITRDDIEAKLRDLTGGASETVETARNIGLAVAVGAGVVFIVTAYWLGRRRGRRRRTVLEIRRI